MSQVLENVIFLVVPLFINIYMWYFAHKKTIKRSMFLN